MSDDLISSKVKVKHTVWGTYSVMAHKPLQNKIINCCEEIPGIKLKIYYVSLHYSKQGIMKLSIDHNK